MRVRFGIRVAAPAIGALVALAACGSGDGDPGEERREIRAAVRELQAAFAARDVARVCDALTADAQRHIGRLGHDPVDPCVKNLRWLAPSVDGSRHAVARREITAIKLDGDRAVAVMRLSRNAVGRVPIAREDGVWKVDALYGDIPARRQPDSYR